MPLAVADLDADDDAVDRGQRLLHLQPAEAAPTGRVDARRILDHQALIAPLASGGEGGLQGVLVAGDGEERSGEPATVLDEGQIDGIQPGAPVAQRFAEQRLDGRLPRRVVAGAQGQEVEGHVDDRHLGLDGRRRRLAAEPGLQADERQDQAVAVGQDLPVDDAGPWQRPGGLDDLRELAADVVQVARVQAHVLAALVELGADAVVLVLDPDLGPEAADDLGRVLGRRGEHELERMEQRQLGVGEPVVAGQRREPADIAGEHPGPLHVVE